MPNRPSSFICSTIGSGNSSSCVVVLGLRDDLLVDELADHLEDGLLLVGLLVERGGYGHGRERYLAAVMGIPPIAAAAQPLAVA